MKKFQLLIISFTILFFTNCDNTDEVSLLETPPEYSEYYVYNGTETLLEYNVDNNDNIEFLNDTTTPEFIDLMKVLSSESLSILTFTDKEDYTYVFDSSADKEDYLKTIRKDLLGDKVQTKAWHPLYIRCYKNGGFNNMMFDATDPNDGITPTHYNTGDWDGFPNLSYVNGTNFHDMMSSIQILNYTGMEVEIQLYSTSKFSGYDWTIYSRPSSVNGHGDSNQDDGYRGTDISQLTYFSNRIMYTKFFGLKKVSWDNQVTSIRWRQIECVGPCLQY